MKKIMIIEDSKLHQKKIKNTISDLDYEVSGVFAHGEKAVDYILKENNIPDLIIIDIILAGEMNGYQAAKKICSETDIPFIFLTIKKDEIKDFEASVYLNKPFNKQELKNNIELALYKHNIYKTMIKNNEEKEMILDTIDTQIWYLKDPKTYGKINQAHADFLGFDKSDVENKKLTDFFEEEEAKICNLGNIKVFSEKKKFQTEVWLTNSSGEKKLISITKNPKLNKDGKVEYVVCSGEDITHQRKKEKIIKEEKEFLSKILEVQNSLFLLLNFEGKIIRFNKACEKITGYTEKEVKGKKVWDLFIKQNEKKEVENVFERLKNKDYPNKHENYWLTKTGEKRRISWSNNVILDDENNIKYIVATGVDITERKKKEKQIEYLSFHDEMTGLYNRRYFENELNRLNSSRKYPITIVIGDLDGLKYINDNYGHKKGDEYIIKAADILKSTARTEDVVSRIGGDEFAVILPTTNQKEAESFCLRIQKNIEKFNQDKDLIKPLSISLGFEVMEDSSQSLNKTFNKADQKMYINKGRK
jgi:diguanylate cyclase (GGDEF)-like protein/PAS domain S-box-containing protein